MYKSKGARGGLAENPELLAEPTNRRTLSIGRERRFLYFRSLFVDWLTGGITRDLGQINQPPRRARQAREVVGSWSGDEKMLP